MFDQLDTSGVAPMELPPKPGQAFASAGTRHNLTSHFIPRHCDVDVGHAVRAKRAVLLGFGPHSGPYSCGQPVKGF